MARVRSLRLFGLACLGALVLALGAAAPSYAAPCTTEPWECAFEGNGNGYSQYVWGTLTTLAGESLVAPAGSTLAADLAVVQEAEAIVARAALLQASERTVGITAARLGLAALGSPLTLLAVTGALIYWEYTLSDGPVYYTMELDDLGAPGAVVPSPIPADYHHVDTAWAYNPEVDTDDFEGWYLYNVWQLEWLVDFAWSPPQVSNFLPYAFTGSYQECIYMQLCISGFQHPECLFGIGSNADWNTDNSDYGACSGQAGLFDVAAHRPGGRAIMDSINLSFTGVDTETVIPHEIEQNGSTYALVISPDDMLAAARANRTTEEPTGAEANFVIEQPAISTQVDLVQLQEARPLFEDNTCLQSIYNRLLDASYPLPNCESGASQLLELPIPTSNQTCDEYVTMLATIGYVGAASCITLANIDPRVGPESPSRVRVLNPGSDPLVVDIPTLVPGDEVVIDPEAGLDFYINPTTAPPVPSTPGGNGGSSGTLTPEHLDFAPLQNLDPGCKFPYGFICYATEVTGWFDVAPDAPVFTFNLNNFDAGVGEYDLGTYGPVDLNVMDEYMAIWRTIASIVMWIGAVYWLAVNLLGFRAGGNPGDAIDDADVF